MVSDFKTPAPSDAGIHGASDMPRVLTLVGILLEALNILMDNILLPTGGQTVDIRLVAGTVGK
ncbi:MAG: hypothetical protein IT521_14785 [Burkholderiales bacterium]|nr:hypothetical protein [Burkholderiales bacterium]